MEEARAGDWRLGAVMATGALGEVREAGSDVVVKRLHAHAARDPALRALFAAEGALTCGLPPHRWLVRGLGFDAGVGVDRPWLALARVGGRDLRAHLEAGTIAAADALAAVAAAAEAAAYLHGAGWVHGDLVPANLLVIGGGAVVCDLGVARRAGEGGPPRGTAAYMAPEQVRGEAWTPAVDVFALGVQLWELRRGARLFHRGQAFLSMAAAVEEPAPPLDGDPLRDVVAAALAKAPLARPTAAELAAAIQSAC